MLNECDILCIQEHWLLSFEKKDLNELFPHHTIIAKSTDDDDPQSPNFRRRGHAGTAIIFKSELEHLITPIKEGSHRILAIEIADPETPILLLNTYMPTEGAIGADYQESLDEIYAIMDKYNNHKFIWTGDINASQNREKPTTNDLKFKKFCKEVGLKVSTSMPDSPTFHHFNGKSQSQIDLYITKPLEDPIQSIEILSRDPTNVSPHDPVIAFISTAEHQQMIGQTSEVISLTRINWKKVDISKYQNATSIKFNALEDSVTTLPTAVTIERINSILNECAVESSPPTKKNKKKKKYKWTANLKPLVKRSVNIHRKMKNTPPGEIYEQLKMSLKSAKRNIRRAQRQAAAKRRDHIHQEIISTCLQKQNSFYKKINTQRRDLKDLTSIAFEENERNTEEESWASYFFKLATPTENENYDDKYQRYLEINHLLQSLLSSGNKLPTISPNEVGQIIQSLKNNKAADIFGITSEHLKYASEELQYILAQVINITIKNGKIPELLKIGKVRPVLKKNKSSKNPTNYRRITITSIVGKVLEKYMLVHTKILLDPVQSPLQFGFTPKCSPVYAAIALTEILAEAKDNAQELHIAFMDTSKAFDVVHHNGMLNSLYQQGINGDLWQLYNSLYQDIKSVVLWKDHQSTSFHENQGIRQGGITSADLYKAGKNDLLTTLGNKTSCHIGHVNVGAIMVADDLAIAAHSESDLQYGVTIATIDSQRQRYNFNNSKTKIVSLNSKHTPSCLLINKPIMSSKCEAHLGIFRNSKNDNKDTMNSRIINARRAMYSLMGAGLHGLNGVGPEVAMVQYNTYVLPTLLYGLEALILNHSEVEELSKFHRKNIRCLQHLPKSTAIPAIHLLSGSPPIEAYLHIQILNIFCAIVSSTPETPPAFFLKSIVTRQLAMQETTSSSWTTQVKNLLTKYNLPPASELLSLQLTKQQWKNLVKINVYKHWTDQLQEEAKYMSSLCYINIGALKINSMHPVWLKLHNKLNVRKAHVVAKLLLQRYPLSGSHTSGKARSATCVLCKNDSETVAHFLLHCTSLKSGRDLYLPRILLYTRKYAIDINPENLVAIVLDINNIPDHMGDDRSEFIKLCRDFVFKMHNDRLFLLGGKSDYQLTAT